MSAVDAGPLRSAVHWQQAGAAEWRSLEPRTQSAAKVVVLVAVTLVAYHYSVGSLVQTLTADTPLAYIGLVPFFAGILAWMNRSPRRVEPPIHDRQLDYSVGLPLVGVALLAGVILPPRMGAMYWVDRVDLFFLPVFVIGATILLFGVRVAWRQRLALSYLWLAWPWPYSTILLGALGGFRSLTLGGLRVVLRFVHVASPMAGPGDSGLFRVVHHGVAFPVSVVTACAGVDGMVGFLLIGSAMAAVVHGPMMRKVLWLAAGLVLFWITNLLRLLGIFWVGDLVGQRVALDIVHPLAGLAMFCIGVVIVTLAMKPFGLRFVQPHDDHRPAAPGTRSDGLLLSVGLLVVVGLLLAAGNTALGEFNPVASAAGQPKLGSFLAEPASPKGWTPAFETEYTVNKTLFGHSSRWFRYLYSATSASQSSLHSTVPVTADVINAAGLSGFDYYGVTACYSFHGYRLRDVAKVDLGDGVSGQALSYAGGTSRQDWSIVYWIWPVKTGDGTRYERIILYLQNTASARVSIGDGEPGAATLARAVEGVGTVQRRLLTNRAFLVDFARQIVAGQRQARDTDEHIASLAQPGSQWATLAAKPLRVRQGIPASLQGSLAQDAHGRFWLAYFERHPLVVAGHPTSPAPPGGKP